MTPNHPRRGTGPGTTPRTGHQLIVVVVHHRHPDCTAPSVRPVDSRSGVRDG